MKPERQIKPSGCAARTPRRSPEAVVLAQNEEIRRLKTLEDRAKALALPLEDRSVPQDQILALTFKVAGEAYAIDAEAVRQVSAVQDILPLPGTPPCIAGIIKMLGEVVSVTDLRELFGLPRRKELGPLYAILLADKTMAMALLAEEITEVRGVSRNEINPPVPTLTGIKADLLLGVTSFQAAFLDAAALLSDKRLRAGQSGD